METQLGSLSPSAVSLRSERKLRESQLKVDHYFSELPKSLAFSQRKKKTELKLNKASVQFSLLRKMRYVRNTEMNPSLSPTAIILYSYLKVDAGQDFVLSRCRMILISVCTLRV